MGLRKKISDENFCPGKQLKMEWQYIPIEGSFLVSLCFTSKGEKRIFFMKETNKKSKEFVINP